MKPSNKRAIFVSLAGNVGISLSKFVAALFTGSSGMLAEAIHSFVDTSHELFLLLGVHQAQAPADERFPYGRGKAVYFWGFIAVLFFMGGGVLAIDQGFQHILHPEPVSTSILAFVILGIALVLDGIALAEALKQFVRTKGSASFKSAFIHTKDPSMRILIFENSLDIIGESVAFVGILLAQVTGLLYLDGAASVIVGAMLVGSALMQAYQIMNLLIGQSADDYVVEGIKDLVRGQASIAAIEEITTLHMGPEYLLVNVRVRYQAGVPNQDIEQINVYLEQRVQQRFPIAKRVYVKAALPASHVRDYTALFTRANPVPVGEQVE